MANFWRLVPTQFVDSVMTGIGGLYASGRWHSQGNPIIYAASSQALAVLEVLVHMQRRHAPDSMSLLEVQCPEKLIDDLSLKKLPQHWRQTPAPDELKTLGDDWLNKKSSCVLRVPAALVPDEFNYLINPQHVDFKSIKVKGIQTLDLDERLVG